MSVQKTKIFFSICIPVYNVEKYLDDCIQSILVQTENDYEIILVDDGSNDRSGEICDLYANKHPSIIKVIHKQNEGLLMARYDAVISAEGEYLLFLDSDDYYYNANVLHTIKEVILQTSADMVIFDWIRIFPDGRKLYESCDYSNMQVFSGETKQHLYFDMTAGNMINSVAKKCIKKELFVIEPEYKKFKGLSQAEDKFLSLPCLDKSEFVVYIKEPLYAYRCNNSSITNNLSIKNYKDIQVVQNRVRHYANIWGLGEEVDHKLYKNRLQFSIRCIESVFTRVKVGKSNRAELDALVQYILNDQEFPNMYKKGVGALPIQYRISANLLAKRKFNELFVWLRFVNCVCSVKNYIREKLYK